MKNRKFENTPLADFFSGIFFRWKVEAYHGPHIGCGYHMWPLTIYGSLAKKRVFLKVSHFYESNFERKTQNIEMRTKML